MDFYLYHLATKTLQFKELMQILCFFFFLLPLVAASLDTNLASHDNFKIIIIKK